MKTTMHPDIELLHRVQCFDQQALAEVYDTYSPGLFRYAMRLLGDQNLSEDCVAETFTRLLQALQLNRGPKEYLRAYLYRSAHNWIVDYYRSEPERFGELKETQKDGKKSMEEDILLKQRQAALRSALFQLTPDQLQVILLRFFEGWEFKEISRTINKPIGAVKALQHRALVTLRQILTEKNLI